MGRSSVAWACQYTNTYPSKADTYRLSLARRMVVKVAADAPDGCTLLWMYVLAKLARKTFRVVALDGPVKVCCLR